VVATLIISVRLTAHLRGHRDRRHRPANAARAWWGRIRPAACSTTPTSSWRRKSSWSIRFGVAAGGPGVAPARARASGGPDRDPARRSRASGAESHQGHAPAQHLSLADRLPLRGSANWPPTRPMRSPNPTWSTATTSVSRSSASLASFHGADARRAESPKWSGLGRRSWASSAS